VLSITEVAFGANERDSGLTDEGETAIDELWSPASPITLIDVSEALTRSARALIRSAKVQGRSVRGADAVHLASAVLFGADAIYTYEADARRQTWAQLTAIPVSEPVTDRPQLGI